MKIQPCTTPNIKGRTYSPNFKGTQNKPNNYFAFMADSSNKDTGMSILAGSAIGAIASKDSFKYDFPHKAMKNIGIMMILMYGLRSIQYASFNHANNK